MINKKLLTTFALVAAMLLPQGVWADEVVLPSRTTPNNELFKAFVYGTANEHYVVAGGTISFESSFPAVVDNFWVLNGKTITCTLAGEEKLAVGDVIKVRAAFSKASSNHGIRLRAGASGGSDGEILVPGSEYSVTGTYGDIIEVSYTIASESQYVNATAFRLFRDTSTEGQLVNSYVRSITITRTGADDHMPNTLTGNKTWNFTTLRGSATPAYTQVEQYAVVDDIYYGGNANPIQFVAKLKSAYYPIKFRGSTTVDPISYSLSASSPSSVMFMVPAGTGTVSVKHITNTGELSKLSYKVGATTYDEVANTASEFTITEFNYDVSVPTPIWIYGKTNIGNLCIEEIKVTLTEKVTLDNYGYATFASTYPLDLANMSATTAPTAYKASVSSSTVNFTSVSEAVAANTGILLVGGAGETVTIPIAASGTDISATNAFEVNTGGTTFAGTDGYTYFGMRKNQATLTFAPFTPSSVAIPANKAYLKVLTSELTANELTFVFDEENNGEATGISEVSDISEMERMRNGENETFFDLQGRRVAQPTKGLYIVNGKKVIVK